MSTATEEAIEDVLASINIEDAKHKPDCIKGSIIGQDELTGRVTVVPCCCKSWTCPACANRLRNVWARRCVQANPDRFITITVDPKLHPDPHEARVAIQKGWTGFVAHWRRGRAARGDKHKIPPHELEYVSVWERHKSGMPHMHALVRGDYIPQNYLKRWMVKEGVGSIVDVRKVNDVRPAVEEIFKYVTKAANDVSGFFVGFRLVNCSRHFAPDALPEPTSDNTPAYTWLPSIVTATKVVACMVQLLEYTIDPRSLPHRVELVPGGRDFTLPDLLFAVGRRTDFSP